MTLDEFCRRVSDSNGPEGFLRAAADAFAFIEANQDMAPGERRNDLAQLGEELEAVIAMFMTRFGGEMRRLRQMKKLRMPS